MPTLTAELATRLGWAERRIDLPPGRYETLLPPGPVADLMIYAYWTASARDADEGRNVFAAPGGGTRIGERLSDLPLRLFSDPAGPGWSACRSSTTGRRGDGTSFDLRRRAPDRPRTGCATACWNELIRNRASAAKTGRPVTPPADNLILDGGRRRRRWTRWSRAPSAGCC